MPAFWENQVMCFIMGLAVGGFLPIAYALLVETIPASRRGQAVVLVAGVGTAAGFLLASAFAHWLIPYFGWRIMWFLGIPTGLVLIALNQMLPESPRFLVATGRIEMARTVMRAFGVTLTEVPVAEDESVLSGPRPAPYAVSTLWGAASDVFRLVHRPFVGLT
ncbi:major facilitator transporter, partial [mine drainage metagenome]